VVIVCTGSHKHAEVARLLAPRLVDGQTIFLVQGGTGGSLVVRNELKRAARGAAVLDRLRAAFPQAVAAPSTLYTGLMNANGILHVANMVANIGRLESGGNGYRFYAEGYTPGAIHVLQSVCDERRAVARAFGVELPSIHQWLLDTYGLGGATLAETF